MAGTIRVATERCDPRNVYGPEWHPKLVDVIQWIIEYTGEVIVTSGLRFRTLYANDSGIHLIVPLRALDIRYYIYNDPSKLCDIINQHWVYDPRRPKLKVAVLHNTGMGMHFHIQVHERTKERTI